MTGKTERMIIGYGRRMGILTFGTTNYCFVLGT